MEMVDSKAWEWEKEEESIWLEPSEESYYYVEKWKKEKRRSVLDLGCGLGRHAILFAKNGFKVTAVDLSEYAIDHLKKWEKIEGISIRSKVSDMKKLPFLDNSFDCIYAYHVISHTDTLGFVAILNEIKRVLKPNGNIYLTLCSKETWSFKESNYPKIDENSIIKTDKGPEENIPHFYVDLEDILIRFNDFDIERIRHIDDCYMQNKKQNSKHYYIDALLRKPEVKLDFSDIIGKEVDVIIDRPLGYIHHKYKHLIYRLNYGYIEGIFAGDGQEQDIYLMGVDEPVEKYSGVVIAVVHRFNDVEDKWIVAPKGMKFSKAEILEKIDFQEKHFDIELYL